MNWLKLYHEVRTDRKLATLKDDEFRCWLHLLLLASEQEVQRGTISGLDDDLLALEVSNGDTELLLRTLDKLQRLRIVSVSAREGGNAPVTRYVAFLAFDKRQHAKPSDRPERVRERVQALRERRRNAPNQVGNAPVTPSAKSVTPRNAHREEQIRTDKESSPPTGERAPDADAPVAQPALLSVPKPVKPAKPKPEPPHPALLIARDVIQLRSPDQTQRAAVVEAVGEEPDALELWQRCCAAWRLAGHNVRNVAGVLDWFRDGGPPERMNPPPSRRNGVPAAQNGRHDPNSVIADRLRALRAAKEVPGGPERPGRTSGRAGPGGDPGLRGLPAGHGATAARLPAPRGG